MNERPDGGDIRLLPCDIAPYRRGNTGIDYVTTFDSGRPGPHLMINALTHGNELCGAHALAFLFESGCRPSRGRLTLSFANVAAYGAFDAERPYDSRFVDEDFNRLWDVATLDGARQSVELARARAMRPLVDDIDSLLDIHSVDLPQPAMLLAGSREKGQALAAAIARPRHVVIDAGHAAGRRLRDYARFDDPALPHSACLVECGYHFRQKAVAVAIQTALAFLACHRAASGAYLAQHMDSKFTDPRFTDEGVAAGQLFIEVTHAVTAVSDDFRFVRRFQGFETVAEAQTPIAHDGGREIVTPYRDCIMVMPARLPARGQTAVRLGRALAPPPADARRDHGFFP